MSTITLSFGTTTIPVQLGENTARALAAADRAEQAVGDAEDQVDIAAGHAAAAGAATRSGFVAVEAKKGAWWAKTRLADFAIDLTYGSGIGYNATAGEVDSLIDLVSGTTLAAADPTRKCDTATVTTPGGDFAGMLFAGSTTTRPYRGQIASLPAKLRTGFSMHAVFKVGTVAGAAFRPMTLSRNGVATSTQRIDMNVASAQINVAVAAAGLTTKTDASGQPFISTYMTDNSIVVMSQFFDGSTVSYYINGDFVGQYSQLLDLSAFVGVAQFDYVTIGGYDGGTAGVMPDAYFCAAQFSGTGHDRAEVRDIHRALLDRFRPDLVENVIDATCLTQSNGDTIAEGSDLPSFTKAYTRNNSGTGYLQTTGVVPAAGAVRSGNFMLWAMQKVQAEMASRGLDIVPVITMLTSGGVPWTSSPLWTSGTTYLGIKDEEGDRLGKTSFFNTNRPFFKYVADIVYLTPKFNVLGKWLFAQGFESDMSVGVGTNKVQQTLDDTWAGLKHEFGFTHCLCIEPFSRGANEADSLAFEPNAEKVRQGMRNFAFANSEAFMVFDHGKDNAAAWSPSGTWSADNLTVDGNGMWTAGFHLVDGVHASGAATKALGLKAGENVLRLLNYDLTPYQLEIEA